MRKVGTTSWEEFDEQEGIFLSKLWSEEFYLARQQAEHVKAMQREGNVGERNTAP
jgi:hypothetical protein